MSRLILIVGTQRSGTSLTAGIINKLGVPFPGTLIQPDDKNPRGYYEAHESNNALDLMVPWPGERPKWRDPIPEQLAEFLHDNRESYAEWGWKDPRFVYTSPPIMHWLDLHGVAVHPVIVKRDPVATARSIATYGKTDMRSAVESVNEWQTALLWTEGVLERYSPLIISFEEIIEQPAASVERIANRIGKRVADLAVQHVDPSLRRAG